MVLSSPGIVYAMYLLVLYIMHTYQFEKKFAVVYDLLEIEIA